MYRKQFQTLSALAVLAVLALCSTALAAGTRVTVRIEGKHRTLLAPTQVSPSAGSITKGGAPSGACPGASAAGALDAATHQRWDAVYNTQFGLAVTSIFGESHTFTSPDFWEVFVNNVAAQTGVCGLSLHAGDRLLFAAVSQKGFAYPAALHAPRSVTRGHRFTLKIVYYSAKGAARPLIGARVRGDGVGAVTGKRGMVSVTARHAGKLKLQASKKGYIRSAAVTVRVKK